MRWNVKVECKRFCIQGGDDSTFFNFDSHIHKNNRVGALGELPSEATSVDSCLESLPIIFIGGGIGIMEPNTNTIINESLEVLEKSLKIFQ